MPVSDCQHRFIITLGTGVVGSTDATALGCFSSPLLVVLRYEIEDDRVRQMRRLILRAVPSSGQVDKILQEKRNRTDKQNLLFDCYSKT